MSSGNNASGSMSHLCTYIAVVSLEAALWLRPLHALSPPLAQYAFHRSHNHVQTRFPAWTLATVPCASTWDRAVLQCDLQRKKDNTYESNARLAQARLEDPRVPHPLLFMDGRLPRGHPLHPTNPCQSTQHLLRKAATSERPPLTEGPRRTASCAFCRIEEPTVYLPGSLAWAAWLGSLASIAMHVCRAACMVGGPREHLRNDTFMYKQFVNLEGCQAPFTRMAAHRWRAAIQRRSPTPLVPCRPSICWRPRVLGTDPIQSSRVCRYLPIHVLVRQVAMRPIMRARAFRHPS